MDKPGRNDPCPCGSGKKYKKCCALKSYLQRKAVSVLSSAPAKIQSNALGSLFKNAIVTPGQESSSLKGKVTAKEDSSPSTLFPKTAPETPDEEK